MKKWLLYPEEPIRQRWELFIALVLLYTCCATPYDLAFRNDVEEKTTFANFFDANFFIDFFFAIDIILNFFFAYHDSDFELITSHKKIAKSYLCGWFIIDFVAVVPFGRIFSSAFGSFNRLSKLTKISKLYKLIKMTRLVRMLKIVKERNKLVKYLTEILKIGVGFERLLFFVLIFLILCHIIACLWIFSADLQGENKYSWIKEKEYDKLSHFELYIVSFYFTVTTITTVGYGDISAFTTMERILCILLMITGVIGFSFATGSLSSILSNYDHS